MSFIKTELFTKISIKELLRLTIEISDSGKNGYEKIFVCRDVFESGVPNPYKEETITFDGKRYVLSSFGIADEKILEYFPELEPVLKVNGMDMFGFDSYPIINTKYHCKNSPDYAMKQYRLTSDEVKLINDLNDTAIAKFMYKISVERYANEMSEAIAVIEKLSGKKFVRVENISHQLENDIVYCITSNVPEKSRGWNLLKGKELPKYYSIDLTK